MSTPSISLASVPRLNGSNYHDWKFAVKMILQREDLWNIVTVTEDVRASRISQAPWAKKARQALTTIGLTIEPSQYQHVRDCTDGVQAWHALSAYYEKNSRSNRISLKRQLYGFKHDPTAPISEYITGITDIAARLDSIGVTLSVEEVTDVLIFNLSEEWSGIASTLTASQADFRVADVAGALIDEEGRRGGPSAGGAAMVVRTGAQGGTRFGRRTCYGCGKEGHVIRDCPTRAPAAPVAATLAVVAAPDADGFNHAW